MFKKTLVGIAVLALATSGCENSSENGNTLTQSSAISECGGFENNQGTNFKADPTYCDAELLHWSYDSATQTLSLADNRILLNCCGEHTMDIAEQNGVYMVTEIDAPEAPDLRCGCMCVFDYTVEAQGIPEGQIPLQIVRDVTDDSSGSQVVFDGNLDLTQGSGTVVLDDQTDVTGWCPGTEPTL